MWEDVWEERWALIHIANTFMGRNFWEAVRRLGLRLANRLLQHMARLRQQQFRDTGKGIARASHDQGAPAAERTSASCAAPRMRGTSRPVCVTSALPSEDAEP